MYLYHSDLSEKVAIKNRRLNDEHAGDICLYYVHNKLITDECFS